MIFSIFLDIVHGPGRPTWPYLILFTLLLLSDTTNMENVFINSKSHQENPSLYSKDSKSNENGDIQCPAFTDNSNCPCYKFEEGLFLECPGTTASTLRSTLQMISAPIHSLSIYDFDRSITTLSQDVFRMGAVIKHLQFSYSHLETLKENSLHNIQPTLESLSIVNGKLKQVPRKAVNGMKKLMALDLDSNSITEIEDYSFYGLHLVKLNIKGNLLEEIPAHAFTGLEESMTEIDLSENRLKTFPMLALKRLESLRKLRLSFNQIKTVYGELITLNSNSNENSSLASIVGSGSSADRRARIGGGHLRSLILLDLSSNRFEEITEDGFRSFPQLKTLSLYSNQIETVHKSAFRSLRELMSLEMSHNRITYLDSSIFTTNKRLQTIDLSHNHIHSISGVFANLPQLREIFLSENNILELPGNAYTNSTNIDVIYLESNAIRHIDPNVFNTLLNLQQLYMSSNFIPRIPVTMLDRTLHLTSLSLDGNHIEDLEIGMFRKLEHLREVRLHNNRIKRIRKGVFHPLPGLLELHIQRNFIEEIEPEAFSNLANLQHINLQDNKLNSIDDIFPLKTSLNRSSVSTSLLSIQLNTNRIAKIHENAFSSQENVQIMWLSGNQLVKVDKYLFKDLKYLERVYLNNNFLREIDSDAFASVKQLKFLDLSNNHLRSIRKTNFATLKYLEELNLSNNYISTIESLSFRLLKNLRVIDLSSNTLIQITKDMFQDDLQITSLNLKNCTLRKIDVNSFRNLPNLNELNFEDNFLSSGDVQKLDVPSLTTLKLSNNNFSHMGDSGVTLGIFDKLRSLQHLTLANCSLRSIPETVFAKNPNLVKLDLMGNHLKVMNRNIFNGLSVFKELKLCHNQLTDFPHIALYNISTLETLTLSGNNLNNIDFFKLSGLPNIRYLDLQDNAITSLSGFSAVNLTQLDYIDLSGNKLLSLPANFLQHSINLQRVDLSRNRFVQIPSSALSDTTLPRLAWLNLTGNPINNIYTVKDERYPFLKELYISRTNMTILTSQDFEAFQALQHLHLVQNRISRISPTVFFKLSNLLTLDLSINELENIPQERLQGLKLLRLLNISHNSLKDLEDFSADLIQLQIFDLSFNQLDRIGKSTFRNLHSLVELHLMGNRITTISWDAFKSLRKLHLLDFRKNYFENIPLRALKPLETNLRSLRIEENPLHCNCDAQVLWEWLIDHQKWTSDDNSHYLRCEQPPELRGKVFAKMEPQQFCDAPLILKLAIQDIQPYSVVVSWQSREYSGLNGYEIVYHALDGVDEVRGIRLNGSANSAKLFKLTSSTRYHICVLGVGHWITTKAAAALNQFHINESVQLSMDESMANNSILPDVLQDILMDSSTSRCTEVRTLDGTPNPIADESGLSSQGIIHSFLTRRLGLIVGCCLGIIVFIVLVSVLGYLKLKKQRIENSKRQHTLIPPEYISYRHFSIPNEEVNRNVISVGVSGSMEPSFSSLLSSDGSNIHSNYIPNTMLGTTTLSAC